MKKNVASQSVGAQMITAADGTAFTSAVTVYVTGDNGTQAIGSVGSGACTHEGNGYHSYAPAQAETNYDHVAFTFIGTGAIPATVQIYTTFPQTGDSFARIGAPVGASISADVAAVKAETSSILTDTAEIGAAGAGLTALATQSSVNTIDDFLDTEISAILAAVDTEVAAIKAKTDSLTFTTPGQVDASMLSGATGVISAATIASDAANEIADALLDRANGVESGLTPRQQMRLSAAADAGKVSGAATTTVVIRNPGDNKDRITATVDADGNRTAITTDLT